ncbi:Alpha/Beta hydrolase protein [Gilbertella persicaria]|uniref:Alpha/Beta hydrolase protein n=1 Tax=Gilbertella persicaria TaxID=101096 RepID=UPI00221F89BF|nr:Alpha/Beta hydrolase protein [Gilbertella persicaria]KAI8079615.1 Alpha/Beta hydrolase protein [Gilbertella persicaria]
MMNSVRSSIRKLPPKAVIKILRKVFSLPAPAARFILNEITKARPCHQSWIYRVKEHDWSGCWIGQDIENQDVFKRVQEADVVLFYVHGGGFRIGSCTMYMDTMIAWIHALQMKYGLTCMIMSIDYRLAPEYRYPSPIEDVVRAYEHLVHTLGIHTDKVIAIGDSAGAALVLEMLFITHDPSMFDIVTEKEQEQGKVRELPRPAGTILISPLVTDKTDSASWQINQKYDYITEHTAKVIKRDYFPTCDKEEEEEEQHTLGIAQLQTGFKAFLSPEVLMYIGHLEVLRDDAIQLAEKAEQDHVAWQTVIEEDVHDWFCVREVVKDKEILKRADNIFADFCYRAIGGPIRKEACDQRIK